MWHEHLTLEIAAMFERLQRSALQRRDEVLCDLWHARKRRQAEWARDNLAWRKAAHPQHYQAWLARRRTLDQQRRLKAYLEQGLDVGECAHCGKSFPRTEYQGQRQKYCSRACANRRNGQRRVARQRQERPPIKCKACGKTFTPPRVNASHCSRECTRETDRRQKRTTKQQRACQWCGRQFLASRKDKIFCNPRCVDRAKHARRRKA